MKTSHSSVSLVVAAAALAAALTSCSTPPWVDVAVAEERASAASPSSTASVSPTPTVEPNEQGASPESSVEPSPSPTVEPVTNDLAAGSLETIVEAGPVNLDLRVWSELPMTDWTPSVTKPLSVRVSTDSATGATLRALRVTADARVDGRWEALSSSRIQTPRAPINADLLHPSSSIQTVTLGAAPENADALRLTVVLDVMIEDELSRSAYSGSEVVTVALEP